jgi:putative membrane protein
VPTPTLKDASSLRDGRWYRLHPLTPVLQGGLVIAGLLGFVVAALWETVILRIILVLIGVDPDEAPESDTLFRLIDWITSFAGVILVVGILGITVVWLQWRLHVVRMDDDVIEVKKGVIFRSSRRARRDRVNTVGVRRPLIPRLLGLAKLDIQAAGSDANVVLAYLPHTTAQAVRREILESTDATTPQEEQADQRITRVVEVPLFRYLASLVVSVETVVLMAALTVVVIVALQAEEVITWLGVIIALFTYVVYLAGQFFRVGSFIVDTVDDDMRVSLGLLSTSVETIPPVRIHALQISQPWPWKVFGWWRIDANLASSPGAQVSKAPSHTVIVPVATLPEVLRIVSLCIPSFSESTRADVLTGALEKPHQVWVADHPELLASIGSSPRAKFMIPLSARVNGAALLDDVVLLRTGRWITKLAITPLARVQSSSVSIGPWHAALGLSAFALHSVSGPVGTRVPALDREQAESWWASVNHAAIRAIARSMPRTTKRSGNPT